MALLTVPSLARSLSWSSHESSGWALKGPSFGVLDETTPNRLTNFVAANWPLPGNCAYHEVKARPALQHHLFEATCEGKPLFGVSVHVSVLEQNVVMVSGSVSDELTGLELALESSMQLASVNTDGTLEGFWIDQSLGFQKTVPAVRYEGRNSMGRPCFHVKLTGSQRVVQEECLVFDASAEVFHSNRLDRQLETVTWDNLVDGMLVTKTLEAYGPTRASPRPKAETGMFILSPDREADKLLFDQVQTFYAANRAENWFRDHVGYSPGSSVMRITSNSADPSDIRNAYYLPALGTQPAEIVVGPGDGSTFVSLPRDNDVVFHEFSHHIIYRSLKLASGESGILHEGTADYFAYAISGDPALAETVPKDKPYLRTAALDVGQRFDDPRNSPERHFLGQFWSAVLWQLREELGQKFDLVAYKAIDYLPPAGTLRDYFSGLLHADREVFGAREGEGATARGPHYCRIIEVGLQRGFAQSLRYLDGGPCGLDLASLALEAKEWRAGISGTNSTKASSEDTSLIKGCGALNSREKASESERLILLCMTLPLFLAMAQRRHAIEDRVTAPIRACLKSSRSRPKEEENRSLLLVNEDFPTTENAELELFKQALKDDGGPHGN